MKQLFLLSIFLIIGMFSPSLLFGQLPPDFFEERLDASFNLPVGIHFDKKGRGYVWEKGGKVFILDSLDNPLPEPFIDLSEEVGEWRDHGLLGLALHPNFYENGYVYLMYTVDRHHLLYYGTDDYHQDSTIVEQATIGRIVRYTAESESNFTSVDPASRHIILGKTMSDGFPITANFHGVGSLVFAEDGTLLASCGDGGIDVDPDHPNETYHAQQALNDGIIREEEFLGPFRAQLVNNLNGKIIRIDPETGEGVPGNPFYEPGDPNKPASKVFALGFRNPYRFILVPETGAHFPNEGNPGAMIIGDVGEGRWEELNLVEKPGFNGGWPIFEGLKKHYDWSSDIRENQDEPNPLYVQDGCDIPYFRFQDLIMQASLNPVSFPNPCDPFQEIPANVPTFEHNRPALAWSHSLWNLPERAIYPDYDDDGQATEIEVTDPESRIASAPFGGFSSIPGFWYEEGDLPASFNNSCFVADFSGWIKVFHMNDSLELTAIDSFRNDIKGIVDMAFNPAKQAIYYLNIFNGALFRISYGGNPPPVARIEADTLYGVSPLTVTLDGSNSFDANGPIASYAWDFGDGENSQEAQVTHVFTSPDQNPHAYEVTLTVTDTSGAQHTTRERISLNNSPPHVEIKGIENGDYYPVSDYTHLPLAATVSDAEHSGGDLEFEWQTFLHHNAHYHPEPIDTHRMTFTTIDPLGCGEETYWFRIRLTVTDAAGLQGQDEIEIFPWCGEFDAYVEPFDGDVLEHSIRLNWESHGDNDIASFEVQKLATNSRIRTIGQLDHDGSVAYSFEDLSPILGNNAYRLKLLRDDGVYDYSQWIQLEYPPLKELRLFPNPAPRGQTTLKFANALDDIIHLDIYTLIGQKIRSVDFPVVKGTENLVKLNTSTLSPGVYLLDIQNGPEELERTLFIH